MAISYLFVFLCAEKIPKGPSPEDLSYAWHCSNKLLKKMDSGHIKIKYLHDDARICSQSTLHPLAEIKLHQGKSVRGAAGCSHSGAVFLTPEMFFLF